MIQREIRCGGSPEQENVPENKKSMHFLSFRSPYWDSKKTDSKCVPQSHRHMYQLQPYQSCCWSFDRTPPKIKWLKKGFSQWRLTTVIPKLLLIFQVHLTQGKVSQKEIFAVKIDNPITRTIVLHYFSNM